MSLAFNKIASPTQIGDVAFWFDYFASPKTVGDSAGGNHFKNIEDTISGYVLRTGTKTTSPVSTEEFEDEGTGFQVNEGSRMMCTDNVAADFAFMHQSDITIIMRCKHADFSTGTGNTFYYATGRGNEQSIQCNYELANERRRLYLYEGGVGTTNVERPYQDSKYPVSIQADTFFNQTIIVNHTDDMLKFLNNGIETFSKSIGVPSVNNPRFPLTIGGTDTATSLNTFVWSQFIVFNKVLTDAQIQQVNSFLNNYGG